MTAKKKTGADLRLPSMAVIMKPIAPKDLYHMIFYAAVLMSISATTAAIPITMDLSILPAKLLGSCVAVYALWKMHRIIEGA